MLQTPKEDTLNFFLEEICLLLCKDIYYCDSDEV